MPAVHWSAEMDSALLGKRAAGLTLRECAQDLGVGYGTAQARYSLLTASKAEKREPAFTVQPIPTPNRPLDEILRDQSARFREKQARWETKREGIEIRLHEDGPFALVAFGDPHADDDGCDLERLCYDLELVRANEHVYPFNMGDLTNNWLKVLGHLYSHQHTTDDEAEAVMEWIVSAVPWLFVILGNHDKWGPLAARICRDKNVTYVSHGAMFKIVCGDRTITLDARHTHPGNSMYNASHGQIKRNHRGSPADIIVGAHTHQSAYTMLKNGVTGKIGHAVRVGAYKRFDEYADQLGLDDSCISPSVMFVVDPKAGPEGLVSVFHDLDKGLTFLQALRA